MHFCRVQVVVKGEKEMVNWVMNGIDCCWARFCPHHLTMHADCCDGVLAQVIGCTDQRLQGTVNMCMKKHRRTRAAIII